MRGVRVVPVLTREYNIDHMLHTVSTGFGFIKAGIHRALLNVAFLQYINVNGRRFIRVIAIYGVIMSLYGIKFRFKHEYLVKLC